MRIMDLKKVISTIYKSGTALHLVGPPGVGKSDVVENDLIAILSAEYGEQFGFHDVLLPTVDAPDVRGFLVPTKLSDGTPSSFYTRSGIMPSKEYLAAHPRGIMFLDERNSADILTQKAVAPVILKKRFGDERLPDGWMIVSASNRMVDRAGVARALSITTNREATINIQADVQSWSILAEEQGLHPLMIAFAKSRPGVVFPDAVPKEEGPFCSARSFTAAARVVALVAGVDANGNPNMKLQCDSLQSQLVSGSIGEAATAEVMAYIKLGDQLPTIDEVEANPAAAKCPKDLSAAYAAAQMCLYHAKAANIDKIWTYAQRLPREIQVSTAQSMVARGGGILLNSPSMTAWIAQNQALIITSSSKQ